MRRWQDCAEKMDDQHRASNANTNTNTNTNTTIAERHATWVRCGTFSGDPSDDLFGRDKHHGQTRARLVRAETFRNVSLVRPVGEEPCISGWIPKGVVTLVIDLIAREAHAISVLD